jgi:hypothetical protein
MAASVVDTQPAPLAIGIPCTMFLVLCDRTKGLHHHIQDVSLMQLHHHPAYLTHADDGALTTIDLHDRSPLLVVHPDMKAR